VTRRPAPQGQRFPGAYRLKHRRLLRPLFRRGEAGTVAAGCLRLLFRRVPRDAGQPAVQVAFLPGRQPDAVTRNRVRRILREVLRRHLARLVDLLPLAPAEMLTLGILLRGAPGPDLYARVSEDLPRALDRMLGALGASGGLADAPSSHNPAPDAA
jgi:RNase P protein component